jgi:uncharacterized protein (TIGR02611 family)
VGTIDDMIGRVAEGWRCFKASQPGHRFQDRYRRRHQEGKQGWLAPSTLLYVVGGLIIAVGSVVFGVLPGPGTLTFFLGLGMIAGEFRPVARLLDWAEVRVRKLGRWIEATWRSSVAGKVLVASVAAICLAAILCITYLWLAGGRL